MPNLNPITVYLTFITAAVGKRSDKTLSKFVATGNGTTTDYEPTSENFKKLVNADCAFNIEESDIVYLPATDDVTRMKFLRIIQVGQKCIRVLSDGKMIFAPPPSAKSRRPQFFKTKRKVFTGVKQNSLYW